MTRVRRAFTMVEMTAVIAILGLVASVASGLIFSAATTYADAATTAQLHDEAAVALETVVRALREIPRDAGAPGYAPDIDQVLPDGIRYGGTTIITLSGPDLQISESGGPMRRIVSDVTGFVLQCYDRDDVALPTGLSGAACAPIRRIEVTLTVARAGATETLRTRVYLRSMAGEAP